MIDFVHDFSRTVLVVRLKLIPLRVSRAFTIGDNAKLSWDTGVELTAHDGRDVIRRSFRVR